MATNARLLSLTAAALVAIAVAACSGAVAGGPGSTPGSTPSPTPVNPGPSDAPAQPTPVSTPAPVDPGDDDDKPVRVRLDTEIARDLYIEIVDRSGHVVGAESGNPRDGASVAPGEVKVDNVDDRTIRLTWSDMATDRDASLFIDDDGTGLILVQPEGEGDLMPFDRILVLQYDGPISADDLRVTIQDGLDTPG